MTKVVIPDGVTSIGEKALWGCKSLTSIAIPNSVTSISEEAFSGCSSLTSLRIPAHLVKELNQILPKTKHLIAIHADSITDISTKFRPNAAIGFAEDDRDITDENGKKYAKYIKANAAKLAGVACEHPALLYLMIREKLIAAKDLETVTAAVQATGNL